MPRLLQAVLLLLLSVALPQAARADTVTVFAAASLKTALDQISERYEKETGDALRISYAGSSRLARQIQQGAPAQIFVSANAAWMDVLEGEGLLAAATRADLLVNRIVLVAGPGAPEGLSLALAPGTDLAGTLGDGRLAMALVEAVPAGIYGKAALQSLQLWDSVAPSVAQADNVRAALRLVASGEAPLGIVYATDAMAEPKVRVLDLFPEDSHPPIRYPAAILAEGDGPAARAALRYLRGDVARAIFLRNGFGLPEGAPE
ncbi:MAG: molybdate ABC transporter substrate-binding protein [Antarcticimicrobium sp.]|uniref:molybdate ABC transporter substrate-binding protein n=1 Tax=Antarcticimicrobium sp. TaxID=2824147 RepID=UPI0026055B94|nr:molybdate ABC transporter substrate-binding protein [Antarcticimicrobium sp.]MDF1716155.1 molybdate ABC transporter substrate-binding protein [Antarcticimicrobium sp.]